MKSLFVLRHAKSSWKFPELTDFERPLNKRGRRTAPFMGELMKSKDLVPDLIVSSPAERAQQTASLVKEAAQFEAEIKFDRRIYEAGTQSLLYVVGEIENNVSNVMIVGHNPGFESLVRVLSGEGGRMPTATLAVIDLDIENWNEISSNCGKLRELLRPKEQANYFRAG